MKYFKKDNGGVLAVESEKNISPSIGNITEISESDYHEAVREYEEKRMKENADAANNLSDLYEQLRSANGTTQKVDLLVEIALFGQSGGNKNNR